MICRNPDCEVGEVAVGCLDANGKYFVFCSDCYVQGPYRDTHTVFCSDCYVQGPYRDTHAEAVDAYRRISRFF